MTQSLYVVEKHNSKANYQQVVGVFDSKEKADAGGKQSLEFQDSGKWNITITILPLNNELG
jgi:hypothetical protein|tara:strand:+ start:406 stop:588 length:183 start_codon:yes stop_codon:yes gene_type:complete